MSEAVNLCRQLVRFPSCNGNNAEVMSFLQNYLEQSGFHVRVLTYVGKDGKSVQNLCADYGAGKPHLLFAGHIDVVPSGDESAWQYAPFDAMVDNDTIYGRGIADMKGGVACFLQACRDFIMSGKSCGKITIVISGDEEEPVVEGTQKVLAQLSSESEKFDFALVGEPTNPQTMGDEIKVGRRGDVVFKITSHGCAGHTAYSDAGANPVHHLVQLLYALQNDCLDKGNAYFGPSAMHITTFDVGNTASNVVPAEAYAVIDVRFNSEHSCADVEKWLRQHIQNTMGKFDVEVLPIGESFLSPINNHVKLLHKIVTQCTGKEPVFSTAGGTSDARFIRQYCPVVEYGLTNGTIHKPNECEKIANIDMLHKIYAAFLHEFFKS